MTSGREIRDQTMTLTTVGKQDKTINLDKRGREKRDETGLLSKYDLLLLHNMHTMSAVVYSIA